MYFGYLPHTVIILSGQYTLLNIPNVLWISPTYNHYTLRTMYPLEIPNVLWTSPSYNHYTLRTMYPLEYPQCTLDISPTYNHYTLRTMYPLEYSQCTLDISHIQSLYSQDNAPSRIFQMYSGYLPHTIIILPPSTGHSQCTPCSSPIHSM